MIIIIFNYFNCLVIQNLPILTIYWVGVSHVTGSQVDLAEGHMTVIGQDRRREGVVMTKIEGRGGQNHPKGGGVAAGL